MFNKNLLPFLVLLLSVALLGGANGMAQNIPACDSLFVTNFRFDTMPGRLALDAENQSSYLFDYPGFIFFDSNMDTLAKEVVDYFGIGSFPQPHFLGIQGPISLPQSGFLSLYSGFYDSLRCTWPVTLQDTLLSVPESSYGRIEVFPNPAAGQVRLAWSGSGLQAPSSVTVFNLAGQEVADFPFIGLQSEFSVAGWPSGMYLVEVRDRVERLCLKKLIVK